MVIAIGSMLVKGVYKGGQLLAGLGKTVTGFKQTQKEGKSTETEMKRMTGTTKKLAGALALIGAGGFTALMMTAPQLSAALFRIKWQLKMIAWSIGRHLRPLLNAVAKILKAIRTGNWDMFIEGIKDAWNAVKGLVSGAWDWLKRVYNSIWEELGKHGIEKPGWVIWIEDWILELERIITEKDWEALWDWVVAPFKAVWDLFLETKMGGMIKKILDEVKKEDATIISIGTYIGEGIVKGIWAALLKLPKRIVGIFARDEENRGWGNNPVFDDINGEKQVGGMIPTTGLYKMHTGEYVTPSGGSGNTSQGHSDTSITLDFTGAHFDLAGGPAEIQLFAERLSEQIAMAQKDVSY